MEVSSSKCLISKIIMWYTLSVHQTFTLHKLWLNINCFVTLSNKTYPCHVKYKTSFRGYCVHTCTKTKTPFLEWSFLNTYSRDDVLSYYKEKYPAFFENLTVPSGPKMRTSVDCFL